MVYQLLKIFIEACFDGNSEYFLLKHSSEFETSDDDRNKAMKLPSFDDISAHSVCIPHLLEQVYFSDDGNGKSNLLYWIIYQCKGGLFSPGSFS